MLVGNYNPASLHTEASDYARPDFDPSATDPSSFLVRMRRTHNPGGLDEVPDVSSRGGGLPLLLARAGWMKTEDGAAAYSIRRDGVTIRSTAIADAVPALAVGVADLTLTPTLAGVAPIAVDLSGWQALTVNVTYALDTADGELADGGTPVATVRRIDAGSAVFVTGVVAAIEQSWPAPDLVADGSSSIFYLPVCNSVSASGAVTEDLVIGFGRIQLSRSGTSFTVTPLSQVVAGENASSLPPVGWQSNLMSQLQANNTAFAGLGANSQKIVIGECIEAVFLGSSELAETDNALLAPALVPAIP